MIQGTDHATYTVISVHELVEVRCDQNNGHHGLFAISSFAGGDVITGFNAASRQRYPTRLTLQSAPDLHIELAPAFLQYTNHSCDPNVFFDVAAKQLVALAPIPAGTELRFFYPSTEWQMAQPFLCNCGATRCLQLIEGAAHLAPDILQRYRLNAFISDLLQQQLHNNQQSA